jgi:hypothetical protein
VATGRSTADIYGTVVILLAIASLVAASLLHDAAKRPSYAKAAFKAMGPSVRLPLSETRRVVGNLQRRGRAA